MQLKSHSLFGRVLTPAIILFAAGRRRFSANHRTSSVRSLRIHDSLCCQHHPRLVQRIHRPALPEVTRQSDKAHTNVGLLPDGYANAAVQDTFCANTSCTIHY